MRALRVTDLPAPPVGKTGWPWTEASVPLPEQIPNGQAWPPITIVTPSFNQGQYLEETIRSILLQAYPNLEYIIMDGGSTDDSLSVIKRYAPWISHWESKKDRGQAHAINKGFERMTGAVVAFLNSDDIYLPGSLQAVGMVHAREGRKIILGDAECIEEGYGRYQYRVYRQRNVTFDRLMRPFDDSWVWNQPCTFIPSDLQREIGPLDESLHFAFDGDWILRLLRRSECCYLHRPVCRFRMHPTAKTCADAATLFKESLDVKLRYLDDVSELSRRRLEGYHMLRLAGVYLAEHLEYRVLWSRSLGIRYLLEALRQDPALLRRMAFWRIGRRALLPRRWFRSSPWEYSEKDD